MSDTLFITPGPVAWASSRFRAYWPAEYIPGARVTTIKEIEDTRFIPQADNYIWLKTANAGILSQIQTGRHFFDYCDPLWWFEPDSVRAALAYAMGVTASNQGLADDFTEWSGMECQVIPDCLNLEHYKKQRQQQHVDPIRYIWYGASQNRPSLWGALAIMERLKSNGVNLELTIYDDKPTHSWAAAELSFPVYNAAWSLAQENDVISAHDIAILPRYPGVWGNVKSNNKQLTAWACGVAVDSADDYERSFELATLTIKREIQVEEGRELLIERQSHHAAQMWQELINGS